MKLCLVSAIFAGLFVFELPAFAQNLPTSSDIDVPVLDVSPPEPSPLFFVQQPEPPSPVPVISQEQLAKDEARAIEARYRATLKSLKEKKHQFIHCKLKNGKVLTGTIEDAGYEAFTLQSNVLGGGTYIYYKDLAEPPRPVAAVGTRFKQGAEWTGLIALAILAVPLFIPLMLMGVMSDC